MPLPFDPDELDARLRDAQGRWRAAMGELRGGGEDRAPLRHDVWLERGWAALREVDDPSVWERAARRWCFALIQERALWPLRVAAARAARHAVSVPHEANASELPLRTVHRRLLAEPSAAGRRQHARVLANHAGDWAGALRQLLERRSELVERHTGTALQRLPLSGAREALAERAATRWLDASDDLGRAMSLPHWSDALRRALAPDADAGWPARLTARWAHGVFAAVELGRGLRPAPIHVPVPLGANSFALALGRYGVALLDAAARPPQPFAPHQLPFGRRRHRRVAELALVAFEPAFGRQQLGLGHERAVDQRRAQLWSLVAAMRLDALRVVVGSALLRSTQLAGEQLAELGARVFGEPPPARLLGLVPRLGTSDGCRFVGRLGAHALRQQALERFDEDYFRNPRWARWLRARDLGPESDEAPETGEIDRKIAQLVGKLEAELG
jgi:hypothetical protein